MATKKIAPNDPTKPLTLSKTKANLVMKDIHDVLKKHNFTGTVETMTFDSQPPCRCVHGQAGVLRVVAGRLTCVCAH